MNFCFGDIKHIKTTENRLDLECLLRTGWALFCTSFSPRRANPHPDWNLRTVFTCHGILFIYLFIFCLVLSVFFFQVFSKNSLIKNIFEEEKRLIVEHDFFWKIVLYWFIRAGPRQGCQANHGTVQKSAISPQPGNQKRLK